ncbi:MAG: DUF559 domain-containing protein [Methylobacteriaceae bacterium]|nr:DUF559 domain-containing protein [Methylobacteriaceae bacterium]
MPEHKVPLEKRRFAKDQRAMLTRAEAALWTVLRAGRLNGLKFKRQVPFGRYVADFACAEHRLIVELDGELHGTEERAQADFERDAWFREQGFRTLRLPNDLVLGGIELAAEQILQACSSPSPGRLRRPPSPSEGEGRGGNRSPGSG